MVRYPVSADAHWRPGRESSEAESGQAKGSRRRQWEPWEEHISAGSMIKYYRNRKDNDDHIHYHELPLHADDIRWSHC